MRTMVQVAATRRKVAEWPKARGVDPRGTERRTADYLRDAGLGAGDHERKLQARAAELSRKIEQAEKAESAFLARVATKTRGPRKPAPATNEADRDRVQILTKKLLAWTGWVDDPRERAGAILAELGQERTAIPSALREGRGGRARPRPSRAGRPAPGPERLP